MAELSGLKRAKSIFYQGVSVRRVMVSKADQILVLQITFEPFEQI